MKALYSLSGEQYKQDVIRGNIAEYIISGELKKQIPVLKSCAYSRCQNMISQGMLSVTSQRIAQTGNIAHKLAG